MHKNLFFPFALCIIFLILPSVALCENVLNAKQLQILFSDTTFSVTDLDKKNRETDMGIKVFSSGDGLLRVHNEEKGSNQNRVWSISDGWRFCFSRSLTRRKGGATCGIIVSEGGGMYRMYKRAAKKIQKNRIPVIDHSAPLLLFSNFVRGNQLSQ